MSYRVRLSETAHKQLLKLPHKLLERVDQAIRLLEQDPRHRGVLKLESEKPATYRVRVGDIRILFQVNDGERLVTVHRIEGRDKSYKKR